MPVRRIRIPQLFLTLTLLASADAAEIFVSPSGNDDNPGTQAKPLATIAAAQLVARKSANKEPITVHLADGVYHLSTPIIFTAADSGSEQHPVIYQAEHEGKAIISGGSLLDLQWTEGDHGVFTAPTSAGTTIDQLFINGKCQRMARYPNYDAKKTTAAYQGFAADAFSKERAARWADPTGGYIHAMHAARWGGYHYRITGKSNDGNVTYQGGWQNNRQMGMHKEFRMVENIFEELDAPGEWYHNPKTHTLYCIPEPGTDLHKAVVESANLPTLIDFKGTSASPVSHITLKGIIFRHAARTFMENREPLLRSDWTIYRGGAITLTGTTHVTITDSEFDQPGGNAIFVNGYNRNALIKRCHIHDTGASGICFVGKPEAVRNPLFEYNQSQDLSKIDLTPGPKSNDYPADCVVDDCLIHGIGRVERQPAGVQIAMSQRITIQDTSIYDCARSGINIGDGCWGGHLIDRCDVFDTVLETHDHGSFNSWGRDRYWSSNHRGVSEPAVKRNPALPFLDATQPITIRNSRWRCDHGWDIDLDDGSSNYDIHHNLMLAGGLKFREGYGRKATNNIIINNGFHPHVWFDDSASTFQRNIVMKAHAGIGQPNHWGTLINHNFFTSEADRKKNADAGADSDSLVGDPMFINPQAGDFRVKENSAALKTGFKNFPMDQFGVKTAKLKAIARTPVIPSLAAPDAADTPRDRQSQKSYWLGATLHGLEGDEFSAFGVSKEQGGVQLATVPEKSAAARAGLLPNDLIQQLNGRSISNTETLLKTLTTAGNKPLHIQLVRNQKSINLTITPVSYILLEKSTTPDGFKQISPSNNTNRITTANHGTSNEPLTILTDGKLAANYGPVFANGVSNGAYKMDLGTAMAIRAISSWSHSQNGNRGTQHYTLFGSNSTADPGWDTTDNQRFTAIGTIHASAENQPYLATSLHAAAGQSLGSFRWIVWQSEPANPANENTAWQEFEVTSAR